jgi:toxin ParE1/3/4
MKVVMRESAEDDLDRIFAWVAKDNPTAAAEIVARICDRISLLEIDGLAHMGRPGLDPGTREPVEHPYIIVYEVREDSDEVEVLSIMHGARDRSGNR